MVRPYVDRDFDDLVRRWHETNLVSYPYVEEHQKHSLEDARRFFVSRVLPTCQVWVADDSSQLLGMLALEVPWIRQFAVFPEFQRYGVGSSLLRKAQDQSPLELRLFTFQRNAKARAFYERHGFAAVAFATSPAPESEPDVEYRWIGRDNGGALQIRIDDLEGAQIRDLLDEHLRSMENTAPPESRHALDLTGLRHPSITFWTIWDGAELAGCGALKDLDGGHAEIKSMRTAYAYLRKGVASQMLRHIVDEAKRRGFRRLSLETGSMEFFAPARHMYAAFGFLPCAPFANYREDPNSVFMTLDLR